METTVNIFQALSEEISVFSHSTTFFVIKFLLGIYVLVLLIDLVLVLIRRGIGSNIRYMKYGTEIPTELAVGSGKLVKKLLKIRKRLDSGRESQYKIAIIEMDDLINELLGKLGYAGENMAERLEKIAPGEIEHKEQLREAHELRNQIIHDGSIRIDENLAKDTIEKFEKFIQHFQI